MIMLIVDTLTSNVNRTAANVAAFGKNGGNMGRLALFPTCLITKGVVVFAGDDADSIFELLPEAMKVDDVKEAEDGTITVYTAPMTSTRPL
ncbi:YebC/PmpR family DNA-binding transcriptional regulator [Streptococcus sp.]|uniref:YebC/PmpR family DNA-binding transcriptional regulator n=1 Tax=Streptococcus sp. TaxID=1306 RepID=UPI00391A9583